MKTTVYFDGACYLCSAEIEHYARKDKGKALRLVDISRPEFDARAEGVDPVQVNRVMHVRDAKGSLRTGVDAFVAIWEALPSYRVAARLAHAPGIKQGLELGYAVFARVRPYLPKKKSASCESGVCAR
jgi:predicted DCC family thiol-disulfide oxidoreductase YuxK